jgi:hypothetical protein
MRVSVSWLAHSFIDNNSRRSGAFRLDWIAKPKCLETRAPEVLATESLLAARAAYNVRETGQRLKPGQKLGDADVNASMPVVRSSLNQAGVRLATVLNEAFPDN